MSLKSKTLNTLVLATMMAVSGIACAQSTAASTGSSPAKKELVAKMLQLQQPGIDAMSRGLLQKPVANLMQNVGAAIQQKVPEDKRQATAKSVETDVQKFYTETGNLLSERANKLAPATLGPMLEERFSEDELRQLIVWMESPINKRYFEVANEMQKQLAEKLVADTRPTVESKLKALEQNVIKTLNAAQAAPQPASKAAPAASSAKK